MRPLSFWMVVLYLAIVGGSAGLSTWLFGSWIPGLAVGLMVAIIVVAVIRARQPATLRSRTKR